MTEAPDPGSGVRGLGPTQFNSTQLNSTQLSSTQLSSAQLTDSSMRGGWTPGISVTVAGSACTW
jgi:hypothetical protein